MSGTISALPGAIDGGTVDGSTRRQPVLSALTAWGATVAVMMWSAIPHALGRSSVLQASDFRAFYRAGAWVWGPHTTSLYPLGSFAGYGVPNGDPHLTMNPPHFILAFSWAKEMPLQTAYLWFAGFNVLCLVGLVAVALHFMQTWSARERMCALVFIAGSPFVIGALAEGTVSVPVALALALIVMFDLGADELPLPGAVRNFRILNIVFSGACLGILSMKPQYLLVAGVFLIARRRWQVLVSGVVWILGWVGVSMAVMGTKPWFDYPPYLRIFTNQLDTFDVGNASTHWVAEQMLNVRGLLIHLFGFGRASLINMVSVGALLIALGVIAVLGNRVNRGVLSARMAWIAVLSLTIAASNHTNHPDGILLALPAILTWGSLRHPWARRAFGCGVPLLGLLTFTTVGERNSANPPVAAIVVVCSTIAVTVFAWRSTSRVGEVVG